jgi:hypothetical protein
MTMLIPYEMKIKEVRTLRTIRPIKKRRSCVFIALPWVEVDDLSTGKGTVSGWILPESVRSEG